MRQYVDLPIENFFEVEAGGSEEVQGHLHKLDI